MLSPVFTDEQMQKGFETLRPVRTRCLGQLAARLLPAALAGEAGEGSITCLFLIGAVLLTRSLVPGEAGARMRLPVPGRTVEEVRAVLADQRITVFVPSFDGEGHEAIT